MMELQHWGLTYIIPIILAFFICFKPRFGFYLSILIYLWFGAVKLGYFYPRIFIFIFLGVIIILRSFLLGDILKINRFLRITLLIFFIFVIISYFVDLFIGGLRFYSESNLRRLTRIILPILIAICTVYFIREKKDIKNIILFIIFCMDISAFVAIMQFFNINFFWKLRLIQGEPPLFVYERICGLSNYALNLSYYLSILVPLTAWAFISKSYSKRKIFLFFSLIILSFCLILSLTRSAILGSFIGIFITLFWARKSYTLKLFIPIGLCIATIFATVNPNRLSRITSLEKGGLERIPMAITALNIAMDHPLGIGSTGKYFELVRQFGSKYYQEAKKYKGGRDIVGTTSHNNFLNVLMYWGWISFVILIFFYIYIFRELFGLIAESRDSFIKDSSMGLLAGFIAYIVNACFHNAGPFLGEYFFWYFIGILAGLSTLQGKMTASNNIHSVNLKI